MKDYEIASDMEGFICRQASVYAAMFQVDAADLRQVGRMSALHHARRWNPDRGVRFYGYSNRGIAQAMRREAMKFCYQVTISYRSFFSASVSRVSLDEPIGDDEGSTLSEVIGSSDEPAIERVMRAETLEVVREAIAKLPERTQEIIKARFYEGLKSGGLSERFGITQQRVHQIEAMAFRVLRNSSKLKALAA